jgi:hypothetical protein
VLTLRAITAYHCKNLASIHGNDCRIVALVDVGEVISTGRIFAILKILGEFVCVIVIVKVSLCIKRDAFCLFFTLNGSIVCRSCGNKITCSFRITCLGKVNCRKERIKYRSRGMSFPIPTLTNGQ